MEDESQSPLQKALTMAPQSSQNVSVTMFWQKAQLKALVAKSLPYGSAQSKKVRFMSRWYQLYKQLSYNRTETAEHSTVINLYRQAFLNMVSVTVGFTFW